MNIAKLAYRYGFSEKLIFNGVNSDGVQKVIDELLNKIYNACDVGLNASLGEGFGMTNIEMGSIGRPQIVPKHSACEELFGEICQTVEVKMEYTLDNSMTVGGLIDVMDMADIMEQYYFDFRAADKGFLYGKVAQATYNKFNQPQYMWKNISERWKKIIDSAANSL